MKLNPRFRKIAIAIAVFLIVFYFCVGFFVIQPVRAIPEGSTIMYFRPGSGMPFISSADGVMLDKGQEMTGLARILALAKFGKIANDRKIMALPYSGVMYRISTGGKDVSK